MAKGLGTSWTPEDEQLVFDAGETTNFFELAKKMNRNSDALRARRSHLLRHFKSFKAGYRAAILDRANVDYPLDLEAACERAFRQHRGWSGD